VSDVHGLTVPALRGCWDGHGRKHVAATSSLNAIGWHRLQRRCHAAVFLKQTISL